MRQANLVRLENSERPESESFILDIAGSNKANNCENSASYGYMEISFTNS
jgi:hypothetical protein